MSGAKSSSATATTGTADFPRPYRGRFAPTPSGALHFGSLVAALASFLEARSRRGEWLVRIEDLDPPRERPGSADDILRTLDRLGLYWDGPVVRQSARLPLYQAAVDVLLRRDLLRRCRCSRAALGALPVNRERASGDDLFHPPECVVAPGLPGEPHTLRFRTPDRTVEWNDRAQGPQAANVARTHGDFVLRRRDGLFAYQLAVVVDDAEQRILDVVRGGDLLASTPRQILLQEALGLPRPSHMHVPLAVDETGLKLSKSGDAPALDAAPPAEQLAAALAFLGQEPPLELRRAPPGDALGWAVQHWRPGRFAGVKVRAVREVQGQAAVQERDR